MSERAPYSRVYWSVLEDEKFATVYDDDAALATWLRLLIAADAMWPAPAHLPRTVKPRPLAALVSAGLVDITSGDRFRIHGLDSERMRRSDAGRTGAAVRWQSERIPNGMRLHTERNAERMQDETRLDETSRDETSRADDRDALDRFYELTQWNPWTLDWRREELVSLQNDYGIPATIVALDAEWSASPDRKTLTKRAGARLARDADRAKEAARANRKARPVRVVDEAVLAHELGEDIA